MTRRAWVTVRLSGARMAPLTRTRAWFQTGAVKHGLKTASQDIRIVGTVGCAVTDSIRCCVIESVELPLSRCARVHRHSPRHQTMTSPNVHRDGRPDHSTYRALPLLQGPLSGG